MVNNTIPYEDGMVHFARVSLEGFEGKNPVEKLRKVRDAIQSLKDAEEELGYEVREYRMNGSRMRKLT